MLRNTFLFIPGVSYQGEQNLWKAGIKTWDDFHACKILPRFGSLRAIQARARLRDVHDHVREQDLTYLSKALPLSEHFRYFHEFRDDALYLDIETNGFRNGVTVVGLYNGNETKTMVKGINLDKELFLREIQKSKVLVTFNGASFDLPILERFFGVTLEMPHIDLRHVCSRIGLTGGLKAIEHKLGIKRAEGLDGMTGMDAIYLWNAWQNTGNRQHLERLVQYNEEDIINLKPLAEYAIPTLWNSLFKNQTPVSTVQARN